MKSFTPMLTRKRKIVFLAIDTILFFAAFTLILRLRIPDVQAGESAISQLALLGLISIVGQYIFGNYDLDNIIDKKHFIKRQMSAAIFSLVLSLVSNFLLENYLYQPFNQKLLLFVFGVFSVYVAMYKHFTVHMFKTLRAKVKWLVIAPIEVQQLIKTDFSKIVFEGQIEFMSTSESLGDIYDKLLEPWTTVITSLSHEQAYGELGYIIEDKRQTGTNVITASEFYERHLLKVPLHILDYNWFVDANGFYVTTDVGSEKLKRLLDFSMALLLFILSSPFILLTYLLVKLDSKGPALYSQIRTGKDGVEFKIYKFRSMRIDAEKNGAVWASLNDSRVTRVGHLIRKTRLDELPQIWNILKGDMSFVGPRPERPEFNEMLEQSMPYYQLRHTVKPGLTGWAQVMYPYGASVDDSKEKLQYELYYMKHGGFFQDINVMFKTVAVVFGATGR
jgi:exopolysaccharide biosynthesis polyprenyl glycosylphosphotransferase